VAGSESRALCFGKGMPAANAVEKIRAVIRRARWRRSDVCRWIWWGGGGRRSAVGGRRALCVGNRGRRSYRLDGDYVGVGEDGAWGRTEAGLRQNERGQD
jgi:hypothetical protein